jgi:hypothetical protein
MILRNLADQLSLGTISQHLLTNRSFFIDCFNWLEQTFVKKEDKYLFINLHGDAMLHSSFKVCTHIFPEANGEIKPIFFFIE